MEVEGPEPRVVTSTATLKGVTLTFPNHGRTRTFEGEPTYSRVVKIQYGPALIYALPLGADAFRLANRKESYARLLDPVQADHSLVLRWLDECRSKHLSCSKYDLERDFPTRLPGLIRFIDVHALCVVQATDTMREYVALSHVWASVDHFVMKLDNVEQLLTLGAIKTLMSQIPAVVLDAISFTRDLGFRYLWVDMLCICQDDVEEKRGRMAAMDSIYRGATVTLVAADTENACSGLSGVKPYPKPRGGIVERVGLIRLTRVLPPIDEMLANSKWMGRAWTYSEDQFSRRLLYFTKQQIYFRCLLYAHQEDLYEGDPDFYTGNGQRILHDFSGQEYRWLQVCLAEFSPRIYTFPTDRLDAFKSILTEIALRGHYPFLEGLPIKDFFYALCWKHQGFSNRRNVCYPSWTWAGWDGAVSLPDKALYFRPRIGVVRESSPHGRHIGYTQRIAEEAGIKQDFGRCAQLLKEEYSPASVNNLYAQLSLLDCQSLLQDSNSSPWCGRYHGSEQLTDDGIEGQEKILERTFSRRLTDASSMGSTVCENWQSIEPQSRRSSSSTLVFYNEPLGRGAWSDVPHLVRLSFVALSICIPMYLLPSKQDGLVFGWPWNPGSKVDETTIKLYFDSYTPDSAMFGVATATKMEFLLLSTDLTTYHRESQRMLKERKASRSRGLGKRPTACDISAIPVTSKQAAPSSATLVELSAGYRSLASWMRSTPPPITMMAVEPTGEAGVYERIGIAEWNEHSFARCNPQAKNYLLA
jgi:hypothetical protein